MLFKLRRIRIPWNQTENGRKIARKWEISIKIKKESNFVVVFSLWNKLVCVCVFGWKFFLFFGHFGAEKLIEDKWDYTRTVYKHQQQHKQIQGTAINAHTTIHISCFGVQKFTKQMASHYRWPTISTIISNVMHVLWRLAWKIFSQWDQVHESFRFVLSVGRIGVMTIRKIIIFCIVTTNVGKKMQKKNMNDLYQHEKNCIYDKKN